MGASSVLSTPKAMSGSSVSAELVIGAHDPPLLDIYSDLSDESKVVIYWVDPNQGNVSTPFTHSLARNCANMGQRILAVMRLGGSHQTAMRNSAIESFLAMEEKPEWLLSWDTDMELQSPKAVRDIIDHAEEWGARIATCLGFMQRPDMLEREDVPWMPSPNMMMYDEETGHYWMNLNYESDKPQWCDATGMGFTLIHRSLLLDMESDWHELVDGYGHDVYFCHKARLGWGDRVLYCTDIKSAHWKAFGIDESMFERAWVGREKPTPEL